MVIFYWRRWFTPQAKLAKPACRKRSLGQLRRRPQFEVLEDRLIPATHTWTGAVNSLWSNPRNWGEGAPATSETNIALIFPTAALNVTSTNDIPNLTVQSIMLSPAQIGYTLNGQAITLTGGINAVAPGGATNTVAFDIAVNSTQTWNAAGNLIVAGNVSLGTGTTLTVLSVDTTTFSGVLSGPGGLAIAASSTGATVLSAANTYTGPTAVTSGTLRAGITNAVPSTSAVTVAGGAILDLNKFNDTIGSLAGAGNVSLSGGVLVAGSDNSSTLFSGVISGAGGLTKAGTGTLTLSGANTYSATLVAAGTLLVNGQQPAGSVTLNSGATLGGSGTVGPITAAGTVSPGGPGTGILQSANTQFNSGSSFVVKINGTTPGNGYDQLSAAGGVSLAGNPALITTVGFAAAIGNSFTIITSTTGITGTFSGLANNGLLNSSGRTFQITYSSNSVTLVRVASPTTTNLTSSPNPSVLGQPVTFMATVTAAPPATGRPTGTVTFQDGSANLGTGNINTSGVATFTTTAPLTVGTHSITAVYSGDGIFAPSTSSTAIQIVNRGATLTTLNSSVNPSVFGQPVMFTAAVSAVAGTPTGSIVFREGSMILESAAVDSSGHATFSTSTLSPGAHTVTADYNGDSNFASSTSSSLTQVVSQGPTAIVVSAAPDPSVFGQPVSFTANVTVLAPAAGTPTGTVTFKDGSAILGTVALDIGGHATLTTSALATGSHAISGVYSGDVNFSAASSVAITQTVNPVVARTPNEAFVTALYRDVLQRLPDASGFTFWVQRLQAGASRAAVAFAFEVSVEYRGLEVDQFYDAFLHRPADATGRAVWVNALVSGQSEADVVLQFLTSAEYTASHRDNPSYVGGLYQDVFGHPADPAGAAFWQGQLQRGLLNRAQVALSFLSSTEAYLQAIDSYYTDLLGRPADAAGRQGFFAALQNGKFTPTGITTVFLASDEFLARAILLAGG